MQGTDRIFTGTSALHMVKEHYSQSKRIDDKHWRMYIKFKEFGEMYQIKKDMYTLYEIKVCFTNFIPASNAYVHLNIVTKFHV